MFYAREDRDRVGGFGCGSNGCGGSSVSVCDEGDEGFRDTDVVEGCPDGSVRDTTKGIT